MMFVFDWELYSVKETWYMFAVSWELKCDGMKVSTGESCAIESDHYVKAHFKPESTMLMKKDKKM